MDAVSLRAINRTYLDRQLLLERTPASLHDVVGHLVALQAQDTLPPYVSLWSRMASFVPSDLEQAMIARTLVRGTFLRGTVHLARREDVLHLLPHMQPEYAKMAHGSASLNGVLQRVPAAKIVAWGNAMLANGDLGNAELRAQAAVDFPDCEPQEIASALQWLLPVVQVPPRGLWKNNAKPRWALVDTWLGERLEPPRDLESIILRYIRSHGPMAAGDFQVWSRITGARPAIDALRPQLRQVKAEDGREYLDDPDITWVDERTPAPVRLLGHFDNALLSHKVRTRILDDEHRLKVMYNGVGRAAILIDGRVAGRYRTMLEKGVAVFRYELFRDLPERDRMDLEREAGELLEFMDPGREQRLERSDDLTG